MIELPGPVRAVLGALEGAGYEAWCVGGCVRDALLGRTPGDWDMCTAATPLEMKGALGAFPLVGTGVRHGTVTALAGGHAIEITTYRREGAYSDHRRPDGVAFTRDVGEDLLRRDFTVNAMAWHPARGLLDCFGGQADLAAGVLRCVGDPQRRFEEDALRILRCLRFGAALGFRIEPDTRAALYSKAGLLGGISAERVYGELGRLLLGPWAPEVVAEHGDILRRLLPGLGQPLCLPRGLPPDPVLRWAALLWPCPPDKREPLLRRLRFPNKERRLVLAVLACREGLPFTPQRLGQLQGQLGPLFLPLFDLLAGLFPPAQRPLVEEGRAQARRLLGLGPLAVGGDDLLGVGYAPGPGVGQALRRLQESVWAGELPNERACLLAQARRWLAEGAAPR